MPVTSRIAAGLVVGAGLGLAASCQPTSFACDEDTSCAGLEEGRCEPSGYCSVPDDDCPSGHRYAPHSGALSGQCVDAGGSDTGSTTPAESSGGTVVLDGTTTLPNPDTEDGSDSTTGPSSLVCPGVALIDDPFDARALDPDWWTTYEAEGVTFTLVDGELYFEAIDATGDYTGLVNLVPLPPVGFAAVELSTTPPEDAPAQAFFVLGSNDIYYGFVVEGSTLYSIYDSDADDDDRTINPYDPVAHRWLRMIVDAEEGTLVWEVSPDGLEWKPLDSEDQLDNDFDLSTAVMDFGAGVWDGPFSADPVATFGHARLCAL